jgi:NADPH2:quinone reductase
MEESMRAAFYDRQGPAQEVFQIGELPTPEPGPGEVRVRLRTSGVNPSDWKVRKGGFGRGLVAPRVVPHSDGAGVVDAVGAGVSASRVGERVWIWNGQWKRAFGTAAEYITLPSDQAVVLPETMSDDAAACLGIPALTALQAVRVAAVGPRSSVLIAGGAGAVGHYAIQFAKLRGARVLTTVSGAEKAAHALAAGADAAINYREEDVVERVKSLTEGRGVDAVIEMDLTRNAQCYPGVLSPFARVVVYGMSAGEATLPSLWMMQNSILLRFIFIYEITAEDRSAVLAELTDHLAANRLKHTIARRLPLARAGEAHDLVEGGDLIGNVVLDIA